jgi:hypothetical protein
MERIRAHARAVAKRTSLRALSRDAGVTLGSTKKFIDGAMPYEQNSRLWTTWMVRQIREGLVGSADDSIGPDDASVALEIVFWAFPADERPRAIADALEGIRAVYTRRGQTPPAWLAELAAGGGVPPAP